MAFCLPFEILLDILTIICDYSHMYAIPISKFKATCLRVLENIRQSGETVLITKNGKPIAMVSPPNMSTLEKGFGYFRGKFTITGDIISPISDQEEWDALK